MSEPGLLPSASPAKPHGRPDQPAHTPEPGRTLCPLMLAPPMLIISHHGLIINIKDGE
jgi:hypothetical protein